LNAVAKQCEAAEFAAAKSKSSRPCAVKQSGFSLGQVSRRRRRYGLRQEQQERAAPARGPVALIRRRNPAQHRFWSQSWPPCTSRRRTRSPVI